MRTRFGFLGICALTAFAGTLNAAAPAPTSADELENGAVPATRIIDNNKLHISLLSFKAGYARPEHFKRRSDQFVVYLDEGASETSSGEGAAPVRGNVAWHSKGDDAPPMRVTKAFRALYIELKHGTMTWPDPAAVSLAPEPVVGGGAPVKELFDNDKLRATLVSFKKGFIRPGGVKRRLDTIIAYVDDAKLADVGPAQDKYAVVQALNHPNTIAVCDPIKDCDSVGPDGKWATGATTLAGTVAWHPKDGYVERIGIGQDYRALYIELKE